MQTSGTTAEEDLGTYSYALRFPPQLEREFREDFGRRQPPMLRRFFVLGLALYLSFAILDYYALPIFYPYAWALRAAFGAVMLGLVFTTHTRFFSRNILWIPAAWTFWAGLSIMLMIYFSVPSEPAWVFYAFGLLLIITATYVPSSGDLLYPSLAGWITVIAYVLLGLFHHHMLITYQLSVTFFVISFFLVGMNVLCMIGGYMLVLSQRRDFLQRRVIEEQRAIEEGLRGQADALLLNILPASVADRLKRGETIADLYNEASILFADMVNFTPFASRLVLPDLVAILNDVFSHFDNLAGAYGLERIKTMGDGYLVAAGVPLPRPDHAEALTQLGLQMCEYFNRQTFAGQRLGLRVGVNTGPVVAAVIGLQRFSYDVWGDTVNVASRMESQGRRGVVQITDVTYALVKDKFRCRPGGCVEVKGRGEMNVWHVLGRR